MAKDLLEKLDALVEQVEAIEAKTDCEAWVRRELLSTLDRAHELLNSLEEDKGN